MHQFLQIGKGQWKRVLEMVGKIRKLDMEVCTTLGMLTPEQAAELRTAGLTAYNHNLDTSPEYYSQVTSTRKYEDRLDTIANVRNAGISVCAGGIIGLGEGAVDRIGLLLQLATLPAHPESVPINRLVAVKGTPFQANEVPSGLDLVRCIATARIVMPQTVVRLSAGRLDLTPADQVCLCDHDRCPVHHPWVSNCTACAWRRCLQILADAPCVLHTLQTIPPSSETWFMQKDLVHHAPCTKSASSTFREPSRKPLFTILGKWSCT
jgi:hypothetical protein